MQKALTFTAQVFREGKQYVSFNPELRVASCGDTPEEAKRMLREAIQIFLEEAEQMGTLDTILEEAGFLRTKKTWRDPHFVSLEHMSVAV